MCKAGKHSFFLYGGHMCGKHHHHIGISVTIKTDVIRMWHNNIKHIEKKGNNEKIDKDEHIKVLSTWCYP